MQVRGCGNNRIIFRDEKSERKNMDMDAPIFIRDFDFYVDKR